MGNSSPNVPQAYAKATGEIGIVGNVLFGLRLPIGLVPKKIVISKVCDNEPAYFERVDYTLVLVQHFTLWADQRCERDSRIPFGVEGTEQCVNVRGTKYEIATGGVQFLKHGQGTRLLVRIVDAYSYDFESAVAIHAQHCLYFGHFLNARCAPSSPEIYEPEFA